MAEIGGIDVAWDITNSEEVLQRSPAACGPIVVWQDNRAGAWDVYGADLKTGAVKPIYIGKGDQTTPDVYQDVVVVGMDNRRSNKDIRMSRRPRRSRCRAAFFVSRRRSRIPATISWCFA